MEHFDMDHCYIVVAEDLKTIFLWKGRSSTVRSKFIGAKRSQEIRGQLSQEGKKLRIVTVDEGEEPPEFCTLFAYFGAEMIAFRILITTIHPNLSMI